MPRVVVQGALPIFTSKTAICAKDALLAKPAQPDLRHHLRVPMRMVIHALPIWTACLAHVVDLFVAEKKDKVRGVQSAICLVAVKNATILTSTTTVNACNKVLQAVLTMVRALLSRVVRVRLAPRLVQTDVQHCRVI